MPTLTKNLFWGQGERDHLLDVVEGYWPDDMDGSVFVVGPDKRRPGGHWFAEHGLVERIRLNPDADGRIEVIHRRVNTPINRLRRWLPFLFAKVAFMEVSPFGVTNMANTNIQSIDNRLFIGYDAGRPIEIDPETLEFVSAVGTNAEWLQGAPGVLEPLIAVAAHPASDFEEQALWFVNYSQISPPGVPSDAYIARWSLDGPVQRWRIEGMSPFDSIHDVKCTRDFLVFSDLPFIVDPEEIRGKAREVRNQEFTQLWIVAKSDVRATNPGGTVPAREVQIPTPSGHLFVDYDNPDGILRVILQHIPLSDLLLTITRDTLDHRNGQAIDPNYEGLIALAVQPNLVGRYRIDAGTGEVLESDLAHHDDAWGGVLATSDTYSEEARAYQRRMHYAGVGFDPDLIAADWFRLYGEATDGLVAPADLPNHAIPGSLTTIDLEAMKVSEVYSYAEGAFPSPPTFVPRRGATDPDDGYVVVVVHKDGPKEVQVFDAAHVERGPLARATAATFNPPLLLHSCWMPDRTGPRRGHYKVSIREDVVGAIKGLPGVFAGFYRMGRTMAAQQRTSAKDQ